MAGHSKWANIKHRKGAQDQKRGTVFNSVLVLTLCSNKLLTICVIKLGPFL